MSVGLRPEPYSDAMRHSVELRMAQVARRPRSLEALLVWFVQEWQAEVPARLHVDGVEPDSALGSPKMFHMFMRRLIALDTSSVAQATDFDPRLDTWHGDAAPLTPMQGVLDVYEHGIQGVGTRWIVQPHPCIARMLRGVARAGGDWERTQWGSLRPKDEALLTLEAALHEVWSLWARYQNAAVREVY